MLNLTGENPDDSVDQSEGPSPGNRVGTRDTREFLTGPKSIREQLAAGSVYIGSGHWRSQSRSANGLAA